jgi:hypothetical protein
MAFAGGGAAYYAFRVNNRTARQWMDAIFAYMAEAFGTDSCYISNWILGNEINSSLPYYYMGNVTEKQLAVNYSASFRSLYNAVRSVRASSRVFICLEHCWTIRNSTAVSSMVFCRASALISEFAAVSAGALLQAARENTMARVRSSAMIFFIVFSPIFFVILYQTP